MYTPPYNAMREAELRPMVEAVGSAELITVDEGGFPVATRLPRLWRGDRLRFHMAVANPHWRTISDRAPALAVVTGPEAYIGPAWYAAKAKDGRVVPTWNYSAIHFTGRRRWRPWRKSTRATAHPTRSGLC
jgi:transcriptional regulator